MNAACLSEHIRCATTPRASMSEGKQSIPNLVPLFINICDKCLGGRLDSGERPKESGARQTRRSW